MSPLDSRFTPFKAALAAACLALIAGLAGVFTLPVIDRDEARFAQASAQMLESGNYVEIRFLDTARNKKPVGIHWLQAASVAAVSSEAAREIWAYRLPSVLGAMLAAAFTAFAGARLYSSGAGLAAGALLGVSVLVGVEAGIAKTDAMLTAAAALAFLAFVGLRQSTEIADPEKQRTTARLWSVVWWTALGAGALVKGPVVPVCAGLAVIGLCAVERRIAWARPLAFWPGPLLAAALVLPWLIAVQIATDGGFLTGALGADLGPKLVSGDEGHGAPPGYHLVLLPLLFFPGIALLPAGVRAAVKDWRAATLPVARSAGLAAKLIACFIVPTWVAFELLPTKLPHYVLPAYPAIAVLAGLGFERLRETARLWIVVGGVLLLVSAFIYAVAMGYVAVSFGGPQASAYILGAVLLVVVAAALVMVWLRRATASLAILVAGGLIWHGAARGVVAPGAQDLFISGPAAEAVASLQPAGAPAPVISSYTEPSFAFLMRGDYTQASPEAIVASNPDPAAAAIYVIDNARWYEGTRALAGEDRRTEVFQSLLGAACAVETIEGINYSRGSATTLFVILTGCPREPLSEGDAP